LVERNGWETFQNSKIFPFNFWERRAVLKAFQGVIAHLEADLNRKNRMKKQVSFELMEKFQATSQ